MLSSLQDSRSRSAVLNGIDSRSDGVAGPKLRRGQPGVTLEHPAEMRLIGKAGGLGDGGIGTASRGKLAGGVVHPEPALVFAGRMAIPPPEAPGQPRRMHTDLAGQLGQGDPLGKPVVEEVTSLEQPARGTGRRGLLPGKAGQDLEGKALDRKSTRLNSSHSQISYAVFCLKKKNAWRPC